MAFRLIQKPTFIHTVPILVPVDGGHEEQTMKVQFRVLPQDELMQHDLSSAEGSESYCRAIVADFADVIDDEGNALPMSDAIRDRLFPLPFIQIALIRSYTLAMSGARAKN